MFPWPATCRFASLSEPRSHYSFADAGSSNNGVVIGAIVGSIVGALGMAAVVISFDRNSPAVIVLSRRCALQCILYQRRRKTEQATANELEVRLLPIQTD